MSNRARAWLIAAVLVVAGALMLAKPVIDRVSSPMSRERLELELRETATRLNADLPVMVDPRTRLDGTAGIGTEFHYNYTVVSAPDESIDPSQLVERLRRHLKTSVCSSEEMRDFMQPGVTAVYNYRDTNAVPLASIRVTLSDCGS